MSFGPNDMTAIASRGHRLRPTGSAAAPTPGIDPNMLVNCYTNYSMNLIGCMPPQVRKDGEWFAKNPGVIALLWDASGITSFHIPESEIPADLANNQPQPNTWKDSWRMAFMPFEAETCMDIARPQEIVLNIAICGDWAGNTWWECGV